MRKLNLFALMAVSCFISCVPQAHAFDLVQMMCEQGQAAIKEKRYGDAVGFFKRAQLICVGNERKEAGIWEMIAYASWKNKQLDEAHKACVQAYAGYEHTLGSMNPRSTQILDIEAAIEEDRGNYAMAMATLRRALEYSEGVWSNRYDDVHSVPHRLERIAEVARLQGSQADLQGEYESAIAQLEKAARSCRDFEQKSKIERVIEKLRVQIAGSGSGCGSSSRDGNLSSTGRVHSLPATAIASAPWRAGYGVSLGQEQATLLQRSNDTLGQHEGSSATSGATASRAASTSKSQVAVLPSGDISLSLRGQVLLNDSGIETSLASMLSFGQH